MQTGAFERQLKLTIEGQLSQHAVAARLAEFSKERLAETIASGQGTRHYDLFVNGRQGVPEEAVRPPGPIVYEFRWWDEILIAAMQFLRMRSPTSSPRSPRGRLPYRDRFFVLADGVGVNPRQYRNIPNRAEVLIGNSAPYHRKIDVQMIGKEPIKVNVPEGIMADAALWLGSRFAGLITAERHYTMFFTGQYELLTGDRAGTMVHSPCVILKWMA
jgi:hypothetical protein